MTSLPGPLVDAAWLEDHHGDPNVVVLESTVFAEPPSTPDRPYDLRPGRAEWEAAHIPGSAYADLLGDLSDPDAELELTFPSMQRFAAAMSQLGVGDGTAVIVYDRNGIAWSTRLWWMLRAFGFDDAAVLDGGWQAWTAAGGPQSSDPAPARDATFVPRPRPEMVVGRDEVLSGIATQETCLLNALAPTVYSGEQNRYGRAGHIPGSCNVPAGTLLDPDTMRFLPVDALRERLARIGTGGGQRVIAYCGGGVSATIDTFALTLIGAREVALYDGSMSEWAKDPALPLATR